jgi:hypothetical protein
LFQIHFDLCFTPALILTFSPRRRNSHCGFPALRVIRLPAPRNQDFAPPGWVGTDFTAIFVENDRETSQLNLGVLFRPDGF